MTAPTATAPGAVPDRWARLRHDGEAVGDVGPDGSGATGAARAPRAPRALHPLAWWAWALGLAAAAVRTTNPFLLGLLVAVAAFVVSARRSTAPWARSFGLALRLGAFMIVFRMVLSMVFAVRVPGTVVFTLPAVELPDWAAGVSVGGPVTVELLADAFRQGLRLATLVACVGAANALASPYRLLRSLPAVLYEAGVAVTVALAFVPEIVAELGRMREARRLRGRRIRGVRALRGLALPVLEGGLERAVLLAASMDARGYGRRGGTSAAQRRFVALATGGGLVGLIVGSYAVLDPSAPPLLGLPALAVGATGLVAAMAVAGRRAPRTRYRPDPWRWPEWVVALSGVPAVVAMAILAATAPEALSPALTPLAWPAVPPVAVVGVLLALAPAWAAPPTPSPMADPVPPRASRAASDPTPAGVGP